MKNSSKETKRSLSEVLALSRMDKEDDAICYLLTAFQSGNSAFIKLAVEEIARMHPYITLDQIYETYKKRKFTLNGNKRY